MLAGHTEYMLNGSQMQIFGNKNAQQKLGIFFLVIILFTEQG